MLYVKSGENQAFLEQHSTQVGCVQGSLRVLSMIQKEHPLQQRRKRAEISDSSTANHVLKAGRFVSAVSFDAAGHLNVYRLH